MKNEVGITDISVNMELWNNRYREQLIPNKNSYSREEYLRYLEIAKEELGIDVVRSSIIVGLEPIEDSKYAIEELAKRGIRVVLSPYQPFIPIDKEDEEKRFGKMDEDIKSKVWQNNISVEQMNELIEYSKEVTEKYGVGFGSKYAQSNHNNLSFDGVVTHEDILKKGYQKLQNENIELKSNNTKLNSMLARTLEFADLVRKSPIGKIFFRKAIKKLPEGNNENKEEKSL